VASVSSDLTAVDVRGLGGDERGLFEIQDPVDDVAYLASPPLVRDVSAEGDLLLAWSTRLVVMLMMCPPPWVTICRMASRVGSSDEVGLVDHAGCLTAGDTDEDAFVQPVEIGGAGLDLG
jgi:hypothetical protein